MHRLLGHAERDGDLLPDDPFVAGPAHEGRFPALDLPSALPYGRQFRQHTIGPAGLLVERCPHESQYMLTTRRCQHMLTERTA